MWKSEKKEATPLFHSKRQGLNEDLRKPVNLVKHVY